MNYQVWFMRERNGSPFRVGKKNIKETDKTVTYTAGEDKQDTYEINLTNAFQIDNTQVILINVDKETQYSLHEVKQIISASDYDLLITKKVIAQIIAKIRNATEPMNKANLMMYIIMIILGVMIGCMVMAIAYPSIFPPVTNTVYVYPSPTPKPPIFP